MEKLDYAVLIFFQTITNTSFSEQALYNSFENQIQAFSMDGNKYKDFTEKIKMYFVSGNPTATSEKVIDYLQNF